MQFKYCLIRFKFVKAIIILFLKKRKIKVGLVHNLIQLKIDNNKLNTVNTNNIKNKFKIYF